MEKNHHYSKDNFFTVARTAILAGTLLLPFIPAKNTHAEPGNPTDGIFTGYYCQRLVGYKGYDPGGYCAAPYYGGETISGATAACGSDWRPHQIVILENWPTPVECNDKGALAHNQIDLFFQSDVELHDARESGQFLTHGKVTKLINLHTSYTRHNNILNV